MFSHGAGLGLPDADAPASSLGTGLTAARRGGSDCSAPGWPLGLRSAAGRRGRGRAGS